MAHFSTSPSMASSFHGPTLSEIAADKRSKRNPRQLDFDAAMQDFKVMFPDKDEHIIENVLRKNNGSVEATIDQLLNIPGGIFDDVDGGSPPLLPPKPKSSLDVPGPVLPPRQGSLKRNKKTGGGGSLSPNSSSPDSSATKSELHRSYNNSQQTMYDVPWGDQLIPMLGRLPSNFLRYEKPSPEKRDSPPPRPPKNLEGNRPPKHRTTSLKHTLPLHLAVRSSPHTGPLAPTHVPITATHVLGFNAASRTTSSLPGYGRKKGHITTSVGERLSTNAIKRQIEANQRRLMETVDSELDTDTERFLEDERLALIVQNEEFLRELKRNEDFMRTLEFERDLLATRLAVEQSKNKALRDGMWEGSRPNADLSPGAVSNWMIPMPSERDDLSIQRSISSLSSRRADENPEAASSDLSPSPTDTLPAAIVPVDRSDNHDFKDQLKSMGASSKKKFALLAKKFFGKKSAKRGPVSKAAREGRGVSTLNLLDDSDESELPWTSEVQGSSVDVLFEPLPDNWTRSAEEDDRHFL